MQTNKNYARALGIQWGFNGTRRSVARQYDRPGVPEQRQPRAAAPARSRARPERRRRADGVNLGAPGADSAVGLALGSVNGAFNLDVALTALETTGNGRMLSTPRVTTQNNIAAEMTQGVQIPIQTVSNNTVTVAFRDAALTLKVMPQITAANTVIMKITWRTRRPTSRARSTACRRSTPSAPSPRCSSTTGRRR